MKTYSKPLLLFVSLALALIACAPVVTPDAASSVSPVPATATAVPATATAAPATATSEPPTETPAGVAAPTLAPTPLGPQTYRQEAAGFELDYPAGWISDLSGISDGVILWSSNPPAIGADGVPAGLTKIDVVGMPGVTQTLDEVLQDQRDSILNSNGTILEEQRFVLPSGLEAVRLSISGFGGDTAALLSIVNGHPVIIAAYGDKESFDAIAQSLRPIAGIPH